ncbi:MAG: class I SAM-dependent methyltransferase, partial [Verrucomicrobia bacterium]|nr:class I SAM-dependent methyltransferase [Verrucomicrobiota bacterium]
MAMGVLQVQHQVEIQRNRQVWARKPLLRRIYSGFYDRILKQVDVALPGRVVEVGSGMGNLKARCPGAVATDLFANPWVDAVCDAYELPFAAGTLSHLILFDVFHHLEFPRAFLREAHRTLVSGGRLLLFEPYLSLVSWAAYGLGHPEPVGWGLPISTAEVAPKHRAYYPAQGNDTRWFFSRRHPVRLAGWEAVECEAFAAFSYLLSGGFSRRAWYP